MTSLYAIRDTMSGQLLGGVQVFKHDAPAVRFFGDICADQQTMIARHPNDHELICLGHLDDDTHQLTALTPPITIITGKAWLAAQQPAEASTP